MKRKLMRMLSIGFYEISVWLEALADWFDVLSCSVDPHTHDTIARTEAEIAAGIPFEPLDDLLREIEETRADEVRRIA